MWMALNPITISLNRGALRRNRTARAKNRAQIPVVEILSNAANPVPIVRVAHPSQPVGVVVATLAVNPIHLLRRGQRMPAEGNKLVARNLPGGMLKSARVAPESPVLNAVVAGGVVEMPVEQSAAMAAEVPSLAAEALSFFESLI